jgi:hypothetical protein
MDPFPAWQVVALQVGISLLVVAAVLLAGQVHVAPQHRVKPSKKYADE